MKLTERVREYIPKAGCCMLKRTVCNYKLKKQHSSVDACNFYFYFSNRVVDIGTI